MFNSTLPTPHKKYKNQVIFDFTGMDHCLAFAQFKIEKPKYIFLESTKTVSFNFDPDGILRYDEQRLREASQSIGYSTRIYILGHCDIGQNFFMIKGAAGKVEHKILAKKIAQIISQFVLPFVRISAQNDPELRLKISLIACYAGDPNDEQETPLECINNSFAAVLLDAFKSEHMNCEIAARMGIVSFFSKDEKYSVRMRSHESYHREVQNIRDKLHSEYKKLKEGAIKARLSGNFKYALELEFKSLELKSNIISNEYELRSTYYPYHSNRAKVVYYYQAGRQRISRAYTDQPEEWRDNVIETIQQCIQHSKLEIQKKGLERMLNQVLHAEIYEIVDIIAKELEEGRSGKGYQVHTPNTWWEIGKTENFKRLADLLKRRDNYVEERPMRRVNMNCRGILKEP